MITFSGFLFKSTIISLELMRQRAKFGVRAPLRNVDWPLKARHALYSGAAKKTRHTQECVAIFFSGSATSAALR